MTLHSVIIQKLLTTNAHLGRRAATHHFKLYAYGLRNQQTIIDADKTLICLRNASNFIAHLAREKQARFMFVNTNPLFDEIVEQMTKKIGLYRPRDNVIWRMGGFLTNTFSPKKFRSRNKKVCFAPVQPPDCVVVIDTERKSSVILEASKLQVPIVALVDPNMPWEYYKRIAYPVPANDSVEFVYLFCNMITKTFLYEQKKMKELKGEEVNKEPAISEKEAGESKQIEGSKVRSPFNNMLIVPYEYLAAESNDIAENKNLLNKLIVVMFNDTLGTTFGFDGPKSTMEVCDGLTTLDLIVNQIQSLNSKYGCHIPLVLMNTNRTHDHTQQILKKYSTLNVDILPINLGQHPQPESHGDQANLYLSDHSASFLSLMKSGALDLLLSRGKEYVHVISSDNLGATVDPKILNHLMENNVEYCMEVASPISNYFSSNGKEKVQTAETSKYIDTKNFWVNLHAIKILADTDALNLEKEEEEEDSEQKTPLQEREASSALRLFDQVIGINIPEDRFAQLNTTADLLLLQSDLYSAAEGSLIRNPARANLPNPSIELGPEFEKVSDFQNRFKTIPSIVELDNLKVTGDVWFGSGITLKGKVSINARTGVKLEIPDGSVIVNKEVNDRRDI